jgi:tetratricopeptide (TPR) repeat protein
MPLLKKPQRDAAAAVNSTTAAPRNPTAFLNRSAGATSSANEDHPAGKSSISLPKRLSFRPSKSSSHIALESSEQSTTSSLDHTSLSSEQEEADPLLALFRVHNTNRVKFNLTPQPQSQHDEMKRSEGSKIFNIRKFVRSSLFSNSSSALNKSSLNLEDDELSKLLDPPTPLFGRVGSFFVKNNYPTNPNSNNKANNNDNPSDYDWQDTAKPKKTKPSKASKELIATYLHRAQRYHKKSHRYRLAMKYYLLALKEMQLAGYADSDPLPVKVLKSLNDVHHAQTTLVNSANIVKMGIQHEDKDQLVKALKMYTIAYRMRRDSLGLHHPSLPVLLNMMGSVQVKRGEYGEAMTIYELGLKQGRSSGGGGGAEEEKNYKNPLTTSVTLRDMGMILEHNGEEEKALRFYHASLKYALRYMKSREEMLTRNERFGGEEDVSAAGSDGSPVRRRSSREAGDSSDPFLANIHNHLEEPFSLDEVRMVKCTSMDKNLTTEVSSNKAKGEQSVIAECESGEMELFIEKRFDKWALSQETKSNSTTKFYYDELFIGEPSKLLPAARTAESQNGEGPDVDIAMTLHQIGQIHRRSHRHAAALSAYNASLRGMKQVFGSEHAHIAAILGNIGNLYMESGDNDEAFAIYQEVLGIETLHLGLSHPEVAVTLHNIATIECSRGNFSEGVSLYKQVAEMQKIRFGNDNLTVAITLGCLADAYERMGNLESAMQTYEEALRIRTSNLAKFHIDVGRLMHKLGRLASSRKDYVTAMNFVKKAIEVYAINVLPSDHLFMREMARDYADIQAGLAFDSAWTPFVDSNIDSVCDCDP